jgi:hypothetical protein
VTDIFQLPANNSDMKEPCNGRQREGHAPAGKRSMHNRKRRPLAPRHFTLTGARFADFFACFDPSIPRRIALRNETGSRPATRIATRYAVPCLKS